jgi:protein ImuB
MALLPDKPPRWLQWQGETFAIKKGLGPERILEEWWRAEGSEAPRDYFTVQLESGLWVWIFRQEERWFLHGVWS